MSTERTLPKSTITEQRNDGSVGMKYKPLDLIGSGGSAIAFSAAVLDVNDNPTDEIYLLKEFYPENGALRDENDTVRVLRTDDKEALRTQFLREVSAGKEASQYIYGATTATNSFESDNGNTYIVMPYEKHGLSLKNFCEWLKENGKTVPIRAWARLFGKLSDRIKNLHENAGILHSDISVGNVMIMQSDNPDVLYEYVCAENADYTVILLDFGCAYFQDDVYMYEGSDILTAKKRNVIFTTNEFASPELKESTRQEITTFTDIYSIVACFKKCINAVESGDKYIFSADVPATAKAQVEKILGILHTDESEYIYKARVLIEMFDELIRRIDGKGVSKAAIWEAARKDFEAKCKGRFANLDIVEAILPIGRKAQGTLPVVASDGEKKSGVLNLIEQHKGRNICIYGDGGVGKTTTLVKKMHDEYDGMVYDESSVVPIYIELNRCPANIVEAEGAGASQSHFIVRHIRKLLDGSDYSYNSKSEDDDDVLTAVQKEFRGEEDQGDSYDYLLLLDGLNEASSVTINGTSARLVLIDEIRKVADDYRNVRIILTSRSEHGKLNKNGEYMFDNIELEGITEETVLQYLTDNATVEHVKAAKNSESLMEILKTPLFLTVFARVKPDGMYTRGGLLRAFWQEKSESYYTQSSVHERGSEDHLRKALNPEAYSFMIDFILPALCYEMEKNEEFRLPMDKVRKVIKSVLDDEGEYGILGDHGISVFKEYRKTVSGKPVDISTVVDDLKETLGKNAWREIIGELAESIAVLYPEENCAGYGIRHHHMRDYFVAVYWVNKFKLAWQIFSYGKKEKAYEVLSPLSEKSLRMEILTFIGEYLGEDKNKPVQDNRTGAWSYNVPDIKTNPCDRNLIKRVLDIYRGRFDGGAEYGVCNLVEIMKIMRRNLIGENFNRLDLRRCTLNRVKLGEKGCGSSFNGALLGENNLLPVGHSRPIKSIAFCPKGDFFISADEYGNVKVWDTATTSLRMNLDHIRGTIIAFSHNGKYLAIGDGYSTISILNGLTFELIYTIDCESNGLNHMAFSTDDRYIVSAHGTCGENNTIMIWDALNFNLVHVIEEHEHNVESAVFSPDDKYIASASLDGTVRIWDTSDYSPVAILEGHYNFVKSVEYSNDGKYLISASKNAFFIDSLENRHRYCYGEAYMIVWDAKTFEPIASYSDSPVNYAFFSPDSHYIVCSKNDGTILIFNTSLEHIKTLKAAEEGVTCIAFDSKGKYLVSASDIGEIKLWDTKTFELLKDIHTNDDYLYDYIYSEDGRFLLAHYGDKTTKVWDSQSYQLFTTLEGQIETDCEHSYSSDGKTMIGVYNEGVDDDSVGIWDASTYSVVKTLRDFKGKIHSVAYSANGKYIAAACGDSIIRVWDAATYELIATLNENPDEVEAKFVYFSKDEKNIIGASQWSVYQWSTSDFSLSKTFAARNLVFSSLFNPDGKYIISTHEDKTIKIWDASEYKIIKTLENHSDCVINATFSPDGDSMASASWDGTVKLWNASSFECTDTINVDSKGVTSVSYSPDGHYLVCATLSNSIVLLNAKSFKIVKTFSIESGFISGKVSFSPNGKYLICTVNDLDDEYSINNAIIIWDMETLKIHKTIKGYNCAFISAVFSHDGKYIISGTTDHTAKIWNTDNYSLVNTLEGHSDWVRDAKYSPDGNYIVSISSDATVIVWDAQTFQKIETLEGFYGEILDFSFSSDGRYIVAGSADSSMKVWDIYSFELVKTLETFRYYCEFTYSPDGKYIISIDALSFNDYTLKVWDSETLHHVATLEGHTNEVTGVTYTPNEKYILSTSKNAIILWDAQTFEQLEVYDVDDYFPNKRGIAFNPVEEIIVGSSGSSLCIIDWETFESVDHITYIPGLCPIDCDFTSLHPDSDLSDEAKDILRRYGAII